MRFSARRGSRRLACVSETHYVEFAGHRVAYRVAGDGPAIVILHLYRRREDLIHLRVLSSAYRVFEISPLGYGRSDRAAGYAGEALADQVLAVLGRHRVDRFVVWGYSAAGAMALCIGRTTPQAAAIVCGGYSPIGFLTDTVMRRLDRGLRPDHPSRTLWTHVRSIDWQMEISLLRCPALFYWGSNDRQMASGLRIAREQSELCNLDFVEFPALDHGAFNEEVTGTLVIPAVRLWLGETLGASW
jgi:pimeloyl-ACP methyl ester carboxylesterase